MSKPKRPAGYEDHQKLITRGEALALVHQALYDFTRLVLDGRYVLNPDRPQPPSPKPEGLSDEALYGPSSSEATILAMSPTTEAQVKAALSMEPPVETKT